VAWNRVHYRALASFDEERAMSRDHFYLRDDLAPPHLSGAILSEMIFETSSQTVGPRTAGTWERLEPRSDRGRRASTSATQKILIVDDEIWAAFDMEWVVLTLGHEAVGPAATAEKAIELAGKMRPNLVLMDIRLANNSDGVAAAIEIRQRLEIPSLCPRRSDNAKSCSGGPPLRLHREAIQPRITGTRH
jgi:hypothetical protein